MLYYIALDDRGCRSADAGALPAGGVDAEGSEDAGLERRSAGDDVDRALAGGERDGADAPELSQRTLGAEELFGQVGVAHVGAAQRLGDERLDDGGVHADGHVRPHPPLGPVPDGAQVQEVLEHPEAPLDLEHLGYAVTLTQAA